jgi:FAD/FMN-containing dehydrogenase
VPCASEPGDVEHTPGEIFRDYTRSHVYQPPNGIFHPQDRRELVRAVLLAEAAGVRAKAVGANYSLSPAQVTDGAVIATQLLGLHLSRPFPRPPEPGPPARRYRGEHLKAMVRPGAAIDGFLVHVEAGMHLRDLLADLAAFGLALPTMGAGGQQTIAGAISTGTHGSDVALPPLSDAVRAIHFVGPTGQEYWIEPANGPVRAPTGSNGWCPETIVMRDDELFRAALVSVGRFGVVYSFVLEVVPQYWLYDRTDVRAWSDVRAELGACAQSSDYARERVFADADRGPVRYYSAVLELAQMEKAWVSRRWVTTSHTELGLEKAGGIELCADPGPYVAAIVAAKVAFIELQGAVLAVPVAGIAWAARIEALWIALMDAANNADTMGGFLTRAFALFADINATSVGFAAPMLHGILRGLSEQLVGGQMAPERRGPSGRILDSHDYSQDHCFGGTSAEYFFNAHQPQYLHFVDDVLAAAKEHGPVAGYLSMRFVRGSRALLAMERWPQSVAVEVATLRPPDDGNDPMYSEFVKAAANLAATYGALPHWGQIHAADPDALAKGYGAKALGGWRWALAEIQQRGGHTFSSAFTRARGLEQKDSLRELRGPRSAGVLIGSLVPVML